MKQTFRSIALTTLLVLVAVAPSAATDPLVYDSITGYAGAGKHPKTAITGLIVDGRLAGQTFICYDYILITNDKIKGQVSVVAEKISGSRIEKIATFAKNNVQAFDFSDVPPNPDGCSDVPQQPGFNFGIASDCTNLASALAQGDIVRWTFKFKKAAKLKGQDAFVQVSGSILPLAGLSSGSATSERLLSRAEGSGRVLLPRR